MCGIAGIVHLDGEMSPISQGLLRMAEQMRRRGPDDEGYTLFQTNAPAEVLYGEATPTTVRNSLTQQSQNKHISETINRKALAGLVHRRLSIIDLSPNGHQPMTTEDGRYWIVYNGEIYNHKEIAGQLKSLGVKFKSQCDTEVLLEAYKVWGADCLQKLNGMFAFAIWDEREKSLFCCRDRIGIKPFYYTIQKNKFIFASDIKTLIASGLFRPEPNMEGLYHNMSFGITPRPMTSFKDVYALEQGHWMKIGNDGNSSKFCYWKLPIGTQDPSMTEKEAEEQLESMLIKSVTRRLQADVPVGTFMSGGVDSTLISAIASRNQSGIKAFTLAYEEDAAEMDETEQARATAAMHPMDHIIQTVTSFASNDFLEFFDNNIKCYEEPYYSFYADYVISKLAVNNNTTVVLSGLGADELFAGYSYHRWIRLWPFLKLIWPFLPLTTPLLGYLGKRIEVISKASTIDRLHTSAMSQMTEKEKQGLFNDDLVKDFDTIEYINQTYIGLHLKFTDNIEAFCYMDMMNYLGNHHVHRADQCTMHYSLEARFPFLDHEVVELAFRIPSRYKCHEGVGKFILKNVAKKYIHPSCIAMKKKGFGLPIESWIKGPLKEFSVESMNKLSSRSIINENYMQKTTEEFLKNKVPFTQVWSLVSLEKWFEIFIDRSN
jgi:asparagine synthase (glutamine-hydrolysing)